MTFPDITAELKDRMPELRGRISANVSLADITWFRAGGPAQVLFSPADEADLAYFIKHKPKNLPVFVMGLGSNLLVRDGGVPGVVVRLGRGFAEIKVEPGNRLRRARDSAVQPLRRQEQRSPEAVLPAMGRDRCPQLLEVFQPAEPVE